MSLSLILKIQNKKGFCFWKRKKISLKRFIFLLSGTSRGHGPPPLPSALIPNNDKNNEDYVQHTHLCEAIH